MASQAAFDEPHNPYLTTDEYREAVDSLELTATFLQQVTENPARWKWVMIALHNAVQGYMVLALKGTWSVTVLQREQRNKKLRAQREYYRAVEAGDEEAAERANEIMLFGDNDLAAFIHLYERVKDPDGIMRQYVHSQVFEPRPQDDRCMQDLARVRNEFTHFVPQTRGFLLTQFPAITESGLHVIAFLVHESHNILWHPSKERRHRLEERTQDALDASYSALRVIQDDYQGLDLPAYPLCGSVIPE